MIRIWPDGDRFMVAYPNGLRRAHIQVNSVEEGKEQAGELIASFLDRISAEFLSEEEEEIIRLLIAARERRTTVANELWEALQERAAKRYVPGACEASGPLADSAPESDIP